MELDSHKDLLWTAMAYMAMELGGCFLHIIVMVSGWPQVLANMISRDHPNINTTPWTLPSQKSSGRMCFFYAVFEKSYNAS